jgi:hypothetical protein
MNALLLLKFTIINQHLYINYYFSIKDFEHWMYSVKSNLSVSLKKTVMQKENNFRS